MTTAARHFEISTASPIGWRAYRRTVIHHGYAVLFVGVALIVTLTLAPLLGNSISPFFFVAVMFSAWYGLGPGLVASVLAACGSAYFFMDPPGSLWIGVDDVVRLAMFLVAAVMISSLTALQSRTELQLKLAHGDLERRVQERTSELRVSNESLQQEMAERRELEKAILEISEREQRRIGHDLHDGLGQELTGVAFLSKVLAQKLAMKHIPESNEAGIIAEYINGAIRQTRELARGLYPVELEVNGLASALQQLAIRVQGLFNVTCRVEQTGDIILPDVATGSHLYRIAQEAVNNAIRHGKARLIEIELCNTDAAMTLRIMDDGEGISTEPPQRGMGLHLMKYRARMIGATLEIVRKSAAGGTVVTCTMGKTVIQEGKTA